MSFQGYVKGMHFKNKHGDPFLCFILISYHCWTNIGRKTPAITQTKQYCIFNSVYNNLISSTGAIKREYLCLNIFKAHKNRSIIGGGRKIGPRKPTSKQEELWWIGKMKQVRLKVFAERTNGFSRKNL